MSSESRARSDERESWLASIPEEGGATRPQLLATAALLRAALTGIEVPEEGERRSLQRVRAVWGAQQREQPNGAPRGAGWAYTLTDLLGVVFRLGRKK